MHETEHPIPELPLGRDGEGNLLTDERRAARAVEINEIIARLRELRAELEQVMEVIATESSTPFPKQSVDDLKHTTKPLGELIAHARTIRTEIAELMELVGKKSSSYYPPTPMSDVDA